MQDLIPDMTEIHLPERWAVLEQALRQMSDERGVRYSGDLPKAADLTDTELST